MFAAQQLESGPCESAIDEAKRRWGPAGSVSLADDWPEARFLVGAFAGGTFQVRGRGSSWSAAFADADARLFDCTRRRACR